MSKPLRALSPGKLILSGEHAVVYGCPALALAVDRYAESRVSTYFFPRIFFNLLNLAYAKSFTLAALKRVREKLHEQYHAFLEGKCGIRDVLKMPFELLQFTVMHFFEHLNLLHHPLVEGLEIRSYSTIPMGCGMGSSAAAVMSTLFAMAHFFKIDFDPSRFLTLGREAESLQHGRSSGLDLQLVFKGGCLKFEQGVASVRPMPDFPITLVNTGAPKSTTGQCVMAAEQPLKDIGLRAAFSDITHTLDRALLEQDRQAILHCIRENHQLLIKIGVVPDKVQDFVHAVEQRGGAAKICGAGSISLDSAGILWVMCDQDIRSLVKDFGYTLETVRGDTLGTRIL